MQRLDENLWIVRKDFRAALFGNIGGCATIHRHAPGELTIINPVRFSDVGSPGTELEFAL